ncbi:RNA-guided endonuclease InsQ/TnpB family protein [Bacillus cereus]|uniref:RNA-guided endonuclease InsQ/TnpB family protein n=1 Tax=Bacillus cereus TaxID=1396 RepID=UPI000B4B3EEC|nr:RNA-guided endonuclease TnpB family protein [Bacillus cereus]
MLFRSYKYQLKLSTSQQKIFDILYKYMQVSYKTLYPLFKDNKKPSINLLRTTTTPLFEKYQFSQLYTDIIFPQLISNIQKNPDKFESIFPIKFKTFLYDKQLNILSLPFCQNIKISHQRELPSKIYNVEIFNKNKKWYVNFLVAKKQKNKKQSDLRSIGIDVGLKQFAFLSSGQIVSNPRFYDKIKEKISLEQKKLSKKQKGSNRWKYQKTKINKLYTKLYRQRSDFLHKLTNYLTEKYDVIGIESINIRDLQKKKHLRNSLADASWGEFITILQYKCDEKGKHLIGVERFFPSSQLCSNCGNKKWMPVHIRTYSCMNCGTETDRDFNAALNIENRAKQIFLETIYV